MRMPALFFTAAIVSVSGCVVEEPPPPTTNGFGLTETEPPANATDGDVAEADDPLSANGICQDVCRTLALAGCGGAMFSCLASIPITIGGTTIPCAAAVPLACGSGLGCVDACWAILPLSPSEAASEW